MATPLRNFEPPVRFVNSDGTLTDRAQGFLRELFKYTGAGAGRVPIDSLGGDGVTATRFLNESGTFTVPVSPGNPTASVGLTAANGTSAAYMRADAAPALNQSIAPTWTGMHTFQYDVQMNQGLNVTGAVDVTGQVQTGAFGANGATPQTSATVGAAVISTAATNSSPYGYATAAQADAIVTLLNQIRAALVANGILS